MDVMVTEGWTLIERSDGHIVGSYRNVFVTIWWKPPDGERVHRLSAQEERFSHEYPDGFGSLAILAADVGRISPDVRVELDRYAARRPPSLRASARVIEGSGFGAAIVRSLAQAMALLGRRHFPNKTFDDLPLAARWLTAELSTPGEAAALAGAVNAARRGA